MVHFSFLQEYIACALEIDVGTYYHFTNNLHVYEWNWEPEKWLGAYNNRTAFDSPIFYGTWCNTLFPLMDSNTDLHRFNKELQWLTGGNSYKNGSELSRRRCMGMPSKFLNYVVSPALMAYHLYKSKKSDMSLRWCEEIQQSDWKVVCTDWIKRRLEK